MIKHEHTATGTDAGTGEVHKEEWNADHVIDDAAAVRTALELGTAAQSDASDFAAAAHTHAQADITNLTTDLAAKAPLASPALTGDPTAPTQAPGDNSTKLANTAFVAAAIAALINSAPGALDTLKELADAIGDDANFAATLTTALALKAPLASPALTGTPTTTTPASPTDDSTKIPTTEWVNDAVAAAIVAAGAGDVVGQAASVDSEIALFSGTGGKTIKRATGTGPVRIDSGVMSVDTAIARWIQDMNESGASFANFTAAAGTWSSTGSVIQQTDTANSVRRAKHNTKFVIGLPFVFEAEIKIVSHGSDTSFGYGGLIIGFDGSAAGAGVVLLNSRSGNIQVDLDSTSARGTVAASITTGTFYKLRVVGSSEQVSVYVDGTLYGSFNFANGASNGHYLGLVSYSASVQWRNIKLCTLTGGLPA